MTLLKNETLCFLVQRGRAQGAPICGDARVGSPIRPNGRGGVRESHPWPMDITCNVLTSIYLVPLPPFSLGSPPPLASPPLRLRASAPCPSLSVRLSAVPLSSFPVAPLLACLAVATFGSRPVLWQTNKHSVSQQSNSAASCFLPEPALKYCNPDHSKLLLISIGSGAPGKLREIYGNSTTDRIID